MKPSRRTAPPPSVGRARNSLFLARDSYRRRRLHDASRLLPFLGVVFFLVPLLWPSGAEPEIIGGEATSMSAALFYVFICWAGLIALSVLFARVSRNLETSGSSEP